jgi:hypothetical protein
MPGLLRWGLRLPRQASNGDPLDLCLMNSWDYRHGPLIPVYSCGFFNLDVIILFILNYGLLFYFLEVFL